MKPNDELWNAIARQLPEGSILEGTVTVAQFAAIDGDLQSITIWNTDEMTNPQVIGLLELAKFDVMGAAAIGPFDAHWAEGDDDE